MHSFSTANFFLPTSNGRYLLVRKMVEKLDFSIDYVIFNIRIVSLITIYSIKDIKGYFITAKIVYFFLKKNALSLLVRNGRTVKSQ